MKEVRCRKCNEKFKREFMEVNCPKCFKLLMYGDFILGLANGDKVVEMARLISLYGKEYKGLEWYKEKRDKLLKIIEMREKKIDEEIKEKAIKSLKLVEEKLR